MISENTLYKRFGLLWIQALNAVKAVFRTSTFSSPIALKNEPKDERETKSLLKIAYKSESVLESECEIVYLNAAIMIPKHQRDQAYHEEQYSGLLVSLQ
jgi:hypothetical protein